MKAGGVNVSAALASSGAAAVLSRPDFNPKLNCSGFVSMFSIKKMILMNF